jgi:hypothetical protein
MGVKAGEEGQSAPDGAGCLGEWRAEEALWGTCGFMAWQFGHSLAGQSLLVMAWIWRDVF